MNDTTTGTTSEATGGNAPALLVYRHNGARLSLPCECAQRGYLNDDGQPATPDVTTCNGCGAMWCGRCQPTPAARCHFEYEHEAPDLEPLPLGCAVAGTAHRRGEETSALIINLALERGWMPSPYGRHGCTRAEAAQLAAAVLADPDDTTDTSSPDTEHDEHDEDIDVETLGELAREAVEHLDNQAIRLTENRDEKTRVVSDDGLYVVTAEEYDTLYDD